MRRLPYFLKSSLLISLFAAGSSVEAQNAQTNGAKRKLAAAPAPAALPSSAVRSFARNAGPGAAAPPISNKTIRVAYPSGPYERGMYLKQIGKTDDALLQFIKAAQENPRDLRAFWEQAQIFKLKGKTKLAKSALEQALAISPANTQARSFLVQLHFESGNLIGAASEVGKLLNLNQAPKEKPLQVSGTMHISAPSAAIQIASGKLPDKQSEEASMEWLQSAADTKDEKAKGSETAVAQTERNASSKSDADLSFSDVLSQIGNVKTEPSNSEESKPEPKAASSQAQVIIKANEKQSDSGIIARVKDGAGRLSGISKPVPDWLKSKIPFKHDPDAQKADAKDQDNNSVLAWVRDKFNFADNKQADTVPEQKSEPAKRSDGEPKPESLTKSIKDRLQVVHVPQMHMPDMHMPKMHMPEMHMPEMHMPDMHMPKALHMPKLALASSNKVALPKPEGGFADKKMNDAIAQAMKNKKLDNKISTEAIVKPKESEPAPPQEGGKTAQENKSNLPPGIAKILQEQFAGQTVITTSNGQQQELDLQKQKEKREQEEQLKKILASVPVPVEAPKESGRPHLPGRNYGLLKNNALQHIGADSTIELKEDKPLLSNLIEEASRTFSALVPNISWKLPSIPALKSKDKSGADIVASVQAPTQLELDDNKQAQAIAKPIAPTAPLPLDVTRILSRINSPKDSSAAPINTRLSATIPIAAAPANIEAMLPSIPEKTALPESASQAPSLIPSGLSRGQQRQLIPQTSPQETRSLPVQANFPPIVNDAIKMAEPIIKPALEAANNLVQNLAPMVIPKSDLQAPQPVDITTRSGTNAVPAPVDANLNIANYVPNMDAVQLPEGSRAEAATSTLDQADGGLSAADLTKLSTGARKLLTMQQAKAGAFTYGKPVLDSDGAFITGGKQIRTIKPLPGKPQEAKAAPPEDAITKRMRYLLEHGTANLRRGEAFMFSEETGEGVLFMPDGSSERRKLQDGQDAEKVLRARRPDIVQPKDLQYSLNLLGKLLPAQQGQNNGAPEGQNIGGPTLEQLMNQMNQNSKGLWGWMKKSLNLN